jgi:predicted RNA-binding protein with PIN domain
VNETTPSPPALPEGLLAPVLETAAAVLKAMKPPDVPPAARPLAAFDRRALAGGTARSRLHKVLEDEEDFRAQVVEKFLESAEVAAVLEAWESPAATERVIEAAAAGRLPALASALWAGRPEGSEFALGLAVAEWEAGRRRSAEEHERRSLEERLATVTEAERRAQDARHAAEQERDRLEAELREERRGRRSREQQSVEQVSEANRRVAELEAALAAARSENESVNARLSREVERARRAEEGERTARAELAALAPGLRNTVRPEEVREAAEAAARLAESLAKLADGREPLPPPGPPPAPAPAGRVPRQSRARADVPLGMVVDTPEGLEAVARTPDVELVVDGYNVSMKAWPKASPAEQRDRLVGALAHFQLRVRRPVTIVFDGAEVEGVLPPRRPGLRVAFSAPGQEADEVVVAEVAARPLDVPVVVVSSDAWVREHAEAEGAHVVSAVTLLALLRR